MKLQPILLAVFTAFLILACNSATHDQGTEHETAQLSQEEIIKEGSRLVLIMGCDDCHSPKVMTPQGPMPDQNRRLSGHPADMPLGPYDVSMITSGQWVLFNGHLTAAVGPWGVSYSANLTPHETGIGNWTLENFTKALREGKYKGMDNTRPLLPPMPWPGHKHLKDSEIEAIYRYLMSIDPVDNAVPAAVINPPPGS